MRKFCVVFACVALCGLGGCSMAPKPDLTPVTNSPLPSMQKYNGFVGKDYWVTSQSLQLCQGPSFGHCGEYLQVGAHLKVDGLVTNHLEVGGTASDNPYFHVVLNDGRSGFSEASIFSFSTTTMDPVVAEAECKKLGNPKRGMTAAQVKATCWGPPLHVNVKVRATGKYEQYVYGDNKFVYLRDGIVTSLSVKGRRNPDQLLN